MLNVESSRGKGYSVSSIMRIFIVPGTPDCANLGDLAMLQAGQARLHALWPDASFLILTRDPARLKIHCPDAQGIPWAGLKYWLRVKALPRRFFPHLRPETRREFPLTWTSIGGLLRILQPRKGTLAKEFAEMLFGAELVAVSGCGVITDAFRKPALEILNLLDVAIRADIPCVMLGQGIGPIRDEQLFRRAAEVLPRVKAIFIRECRATPALLEKMGVSPEKILFTGDDAVELAFHERRPAPGTELGLNLRLAAYSGLNGATVENIRNAIFDQASAHQSSLCGVPILVDGDESDVRSIEQLLSGWTGKSDGGGGLNTPLQVIRRVSDCRVAIVGSYHAALFALAQGVPVIGIVQSAYYADKFQGLAEQFGSGCIVLRADQPDFAEALRGAMTRLWDQADELRSGLLSTAEVQSQAARAAYAKLPQLIKQRSSFAGR
jgi:colanic acid/amylovoran biosynthesis protein